MQSCLNFVVKKKYPKMGKNAQNELERFTALIRRDTPVQNADVVVHEEARVALVRFQSLEKSAACLVLFQNAVNVSDFCGEKLIIVIVIRCR